MSGIENGSMEEVRIGPLLYLLSFVVSSIVEIEGNSCHSQHTKTLSVCLYIRIPQNFCFKSFEFFN